MKHGRYVCIAFLHILISLPPGYGQSIRSGTVSTGGAAMTGSSFQSYGTIGQSLIGHTTSDGFIHSVGFVFVLADQSMTGVGVESDDGSPSSLPDRFRLDANYPNPFNPTTTIPYALPAPANVTLTVFDVLGREIQVVDIGRQPPGFHRLNFDASQLPSGIYFHRLEAGEFVEMRSMVLLK